MRYRTTGLAAVAAGLAIVVAPMAAAQVAGQARAVTAPAAAATAPAGPAGWRQVVFADGQRALVTSVRGRTEAEQLPTAGNALDSVSVVLSEGGQTYDLPFAALPFLGRGLDPSLFDAAALAGKEPDGRIPVHVRYHGTAVPHLPGITITAAGAPATTRTASGYLTAASAQAFGTALARQYAADRPRASYGTDGMFAGGVSVSLAADAAPAPAVPARPQFVMHTITITGAGLSGKPDTGDVVLVFNVDNGNLNAVIGSTQVFYHGLAKVSVPLGHYWAVAGYVQVDPKNPLQLTAARLDVLPQFTVSADTTVHTSEKAATSQVTMVTPRNAVPESSDFSVLRTAASGPPSQVFVSTPGAHIWVSPTRAKPATGKLAAYAGQQLASPPGPGTAYQYELSYADLAGTIPPQTYRVQPASLATVTDIFYQDLPSSGQWNQYGTAVNQFPPGAGYINPYPQPMHLPGRQVRYIGGNAAGTMWAPYYNATDTAGNYLGGETELAHTVRPGEHLTDTWNQYPLHPGPNVNPDPQSLYNGSLPSASREGDTLTVSVTPFDDNQPGHISSGTIGISEATTSGTYQISQDGTVVASGSVPIGPSGSDAFTTQATLTAAPNPSMISFELDATQTGPTFPLSTASQTIWTWRSAHDSGSTVPQGWYCDDASLSQHCRAEPMMTLWYHVHCMALNGTTTPGPQVLDLTAGHIQPAASPAAITGATVQVSFDDGTTWHPAKVISLGGGNYRVTYTAPAGVSVTLRARATDAADGSITETITRGYQIAS